MRCFASWKLPKTGAIDKSHTQWFFASTPLRLTTVLVVYWSFLWPTQEASALITSHVPGAANAPERLQKDVRDQRVLFNPMEQALRQNNALEASVGSTQPSRQTGETKHHQAVEVADPLQPNSATRSKGLETPIAQPSNVQLSVTPHNNEAQKSDFSQALKPATIVTPTETNVRNSTSETTPSPSGGSILRTSNSTLISEEMFVDLPELRQDTVAKRLTKEWDLKKFFNLNIEFGSAEFFYQIEMISEIFTDFASTYLKGENQLRPRLAEALKEFEELNQELKRLYAFRKTNVYRLVSSGTICSMETALGFERFLQELKGFRRVKSDFEQAIRSIPNLEECIANDPGVRLFAPYLRSVTVIPACRAMVQEIALNLGELAAQEQAKLEKSIAEAQRATSKSVELDLSDLARRLSESKIAKLRWQLADYRLNPGNLRDSTDEYSGVNQKYGVSPSTGRALRLAVQNTSTVLYDEYMSVLGVLLSENILLPTLYNATETNAFLLDNFALRSWREAHNMILFILNDINPDFAKEAAKLFAEGRIFWVQTPQEYGTQFYDGGRTTGPLALLLYQPQPRLIPMYVKAYAEAVITSLASPEAVTSPSKKIFQEELANAIRNKALIFPLLHSSHKLINNALLTTEMSNGFNILKRIHMASTFDDFESRFSALCEKLKIGSRLTQKAKSKMPAMDKVQSAYYIVIKQLLGNTMEEASSKAVATDPEFLNLLATTPTSLSANFDEPFRPNRTNYVAILTLLAQCALENALDDQPAYMNTVKQMLSLPSSANYDDYIRALGGSPEDSNYWKNVLIRRFGGPPQRAQELILGVFRNALNDVKASTQNQTSYDTKEKDAVSKLFASLKV